MNSVVPISNRNIDGSSTRVDEAKIHGRDRL